MKKNTSDNIADYIVPLEMNGLQGRMLKMPAKNNKKREILLVYGHHASLERMFGFADELSKYGNITIPDLPGFGGMDSFYKIGEKPTLENMAEYLAAFIKLRYKNKRVTIIAVSFGFLVTTKMLQQHPEISKKVNLLISLVGLVNCEAIRFKRHNYYILKYSSALFSNRLLAGFVKVFILRAPLITLAYKLVENRHSKLKDGDKVERSKRIKFEISLWQCNDFRTYSATGHLIFSKKLPNQHIDLDVYHIAVENDRYLDNVIVEQNMRKIYKDFQLIKAKMPAHVPTVLATAKDVAPFFPYKVRMLLRKKPS